MTRSLVSTATAAVYITHYITYGLLLCYFSMFQIRAKERKLTSRYGITNTSLPFLATILLFILNKLEYVHIAPSDTAVFQGNTHSFCAAQLRTMTAVLNNHSFV